MVLQSAKLPDSLKLLLGAVRGILLKVVGAAVGAVLALVIGARVTSYFSGPENYKIYVIGNLEVESEIRKLFEAMPEGPVPDVTIDTKPVKIEKLDDKGDPHYAEQIAREIATKEDTLLVVGHIFSTQTKAALPYYLGGPPQGAEPPIPVILTTETNPDLLPQQLSVGPCPPAMRLSPTDDKQAEKAASFAVKSAKRFWVVADMNNAVYSQYLTARFVAKITSQGKQVVLQSTSCNVPPLEALKALKIDGVFFAGEWVDALILIRQIRALTPAAFPTAAKGPVIILRDWAVDHSLLSVGGNDVEDVFLTHPLTASDYNDPSKGYAVYGTSANSLACLLVKRADSEFSKRMRARSWGWFSYWAKRALEMHRVGDARVVLDGVIRKYVTRPRGPSSLTDCKYERKADGEEADAPFHVWTVKKNQFIDVE